MKRPNHSQGRPSAHTRPPTEAARPKAVAVATPTFGDVLGAALDSVRDRLRLWVSLNW